MSDAPFTRRPARVSGLLLAGLAALLISPAREARAQADEGMTLVTDGGAATIDAHGVCRVVQNMTGLDVMVPHSIPEEWYTGGNSFLENVPENMSTSSCPTTIVGDCFDPRFVGHIGGPDWSGGICDGMLIVDNRMLAKAASPMSCQADDYESTSLLLQMNFTTGNYVTFLPPKWPDGPVSPGVDNIFHSSTVGNTTDASYALEITEAIIDPAPAPGTNRFVRYGQQELNVALDIAGDPNTGGHLLAGNPINGSLNDISTSTMDFTSGGVILNYRLHNPTFPSGVIMPNGMEATAAIPQRDWCGDGSFAIPGPDGNTYTFEDSEFNIFTGQVTVMSELFRGTSFNGDVGYWYTSHVLSLYGLFRDNPAFNRDLSGWDVSNVRDLRYAFAGATAFNQPLAAWDVSSVMNTAGMFRGATSFNQPIGGWDTRNITHLTEMFRGATSFNQPLSGWDVSGVKSFEGLFQNATAFNGDVSTWNTESLRNLTRTFRAATSFNQPIGSWNTSTVRTLREAFQDASAFNQPIGSWNVSRLTDATQAFFGASAFNQPLTSWDTRNLAQASIMFRNASAFNQDLSGWCAYNLPSTPFNFSPGSLLTTARLPRWGSCPGDPCNTATLIGSACYNGDIYIGTSSRNRLYLSTRDRVMGEDSFFSPRYYVSAPDFTAGWAIRDYEYYLRTPINTSNTDGLTNTNTILSGRSQDFPAANACRSLGPRYFLPARDEMSVILQNRSVIPNFPSSSVPRFWTSTASSQTDFFGRTVVTPISTSIWFDGTLRTRGETSPPDVQRVMCVRR